MRLRGLGELIRVPIRTHVARFPSRTQASIRPSSALRPRIVSLRERFLHRWANPQANSLMREHTWENRPRSLLDAAIALILQEIYTGPTH